MQIDIYSSTRHRNKFLFVPAGTDMATLPSSDIDADLHQVRPHRMGQEFQHGDRRIGVNADAVLNDIETKGYSVQGAKVTVSVNAA